MLNITILGISDHSSLTFSLYLENMTSSYSNWRLNSQLRTEKEFYEYLKTQINIYFERNDIPETIPATLWEAFKAYLRGCVISFKIARKKNNKIKIEELEKQIQQGQG